MPHQPQGSKSLAASRMLGLDLARSFAIFGMVLVNFKIVMAGPDKIPAFSKWVSLLEGRAAATFVILAGFGISLMSWQHGRIKDPKRVPQTRTRLLKRAMILLLGGLAYTPLWPADILHFYGIYLLFAILFLTTSNRALLFGALVANLGFVLMLLLLDYEAGWNWETLHYSGFWSPAGLVRHLFFNGFHPVFPWVGFMLWGMWLGRQPLNNAGTRRSICLVALAVALLIEFGSQLSLHYLQTRLDPNQFEVAASLLGTDPMPPTPWYFLAAGGWATVFICLCLEVSPALLSKAFSPLVSTGQMALTHYVAHVILGMGLMEALGMIGTQSPETAMIAGLVFCGFIILFSWLWQKRFKHGPLEGVLRRWTA